MPKEIARLILPKLMMRQLESSGVYCQTWVTAETAGSSGSVGSAGSRKRREHKGDRPVRLVLLAGR